MHSTHAKHNSTASTKKRKSHLVPSLTLRAVRARLKRRRPEPSRTRAISSRNGTSAYPKKTQCFVRILTFTFNLHLWCSNSNAICQQRPAKHNQIRKTLLENKNLARSLGLYSSRPHSTQPLPLLDFTSISTSASTPTLLVLCSALLCSSLLYATLLYSYSTHCFSSLRCSAILCPSLLYYTLLYLYSASILLYLHSTSRRCPLDTMISGLVRMWLHDLRRRCQLDTMILGLVRMWVNDLLGHMPTGHNDLWLVRMLTFHSSEFLYDYDYDYDDDDDDYYYYYWYCYYYDYYYCYCYCYFFYYY